jgi:hypothetical protein
VSDEVADQYNFVILCRMSYPGAVGYATNLACDTALQRSTDQFNFQLNTGGGGSSENNLQSPAVIIPAPDGTVSLSMTATGGTIGNNAIINITETTGNNAVINVTNTAGGNSVIQLGEAASQVLIIAPSAGAAGQLQIRNEATNTAYAVFDTVNNNVTLGDLASAGTINLDAATVIKDSTAPGNSLLLSPSSATTSLISQTAASGGTVTIGSSAAAPNTLLVTDGGSNTAAVVIGGNSGASLVIKGGVGSAPPTIFPNVSDAGTLYIGSSTSVQNSIVLTDSAGVDTGRTYITNQVPPPVNNNVLVLNNGGPVTPGTIPTGTNVITNPSDLKAGLYYFAVRPTGSTNQDQSLFSIGYYSGLVWATGGSNIGVPNGSGNLIFEPAAGNANMTLVNTTGASQTGVVVYCPIFTGQIGGF